MVLYHCSHFTNRLYCLHSQIVKFAAAVFVWRPTTSDERGPGRRRATRLFLAGPPTSEERATSDDSDEQLERRWVHVCLALVENSFVLFCRRLSSAVANFILKKTRLDRREQESSMYILCALLLADFSPTPTLHPFFSGRSILPLSRVAPPYCRRRPAIVRKRAGNASLTIVNERWAVRKPTTAGGIRCVEADFRAAYSLVQNRSPEFRSSWILPTQHQHNEHQQLQKYWAVVEVEAVATSHLCPALPPRETERQLEGKVICFVSTIQINHSLPILDQQTIASEQQSVDWRMEYKVICVLYPLVNFWDYPR